MAKDAKDRQMCRSPSHRRRRTEHSGAMLAAAASIPDYDRLIQEIESFFPDVRHRSCIGRRQSREMGQTLRRRSSRRLPDWRLAEIRKALDRRLWADATERLLDLQATGTSSRPWTHRIRRRIFCPNGRSLRSG